MSGTTDTLHFLHPLGYMEFLALQSKAALVITDSGGIQEETTFLNVPCLTVRENTERPVTITMGTNELVGRDLQKLRNAAAEILRQELEGETKYETNRQRPQCRIPLWDGH